MPADYGKQPSAGGARRRAGTFIAEAVGAKQ